MLELFFSITALWHLSLGEEDMPPECLCLQICGYALTLLQVLGVEDGVGVGVVTLPVF